MSWLRRVPGREADVITAHSFVAKFSEGAGAGWNRGAWSCVSVSGYGNSAPVGDTLWGANALNLLRVLQWSPNSVFQGDALHGAGRGREYLEMQPISFDGESVNMSCRRATTGGVPAGVSQTGLVFGHLIAHVGPLTSRADDPREATR